MIVPRDRLRLFRQERNELKDLPHIRGQIKETTCNPNLCFPWRRAYSPR